MRGDKEKKSKQRASPCFVHFFPSAKAFSGFEKSSGEEEKVLIKSPLRNRFD
jgi:hypothetical protein